MSDDALKQQFRSPGSEWRGAPFWSWNDDLDPQVLRRQIRGMKAAGLGGFFMHARSGLMTPYMSERWMECIAAAVDEAKKQDMLAWLYDEDRFPSGFAGGLVVQRNPDFALRFLEPAPAEAQAPWCFATRQEEGGVSYRPLAAGEEPAEGEELQQFHARIAEASPWYNNGRYADLMNPEAVKAFLDICYQPYRRFRKEFGGVIPGMFTDEPNIASNAGLRRRLPWTGRLPEEFARRRGYDLLARLPELYSEDPAHFRTRHDFWRTVTELFAEAFGEQVGAWCEKAGLELTGHMLYEQQFELAIPCNGAVMPQLEHMQRPGVDILRELIDEPITCKQAASIAHQMGRKRVLSETYGGSGWQMGLEAQKWIGDWQVTLGINTRCQHFIPYSLRGHRKRDWPLFFWEYQPWWKYFRVIEDYSARTCLFASIGEPVQEVLLLHSITTSWGLGLDREVWKKEGQRFVEMAEHLLALHYDFDLGDEMVMARHAAVRGRRLAVGKAAYKVVILPESDTIFRSTVELLQQFLDAGGRVICMRRRPTRIEGVPAPELDALFARPNVTHILPTRMELEDALRAALPRRVSITADSPRQLSQVIYQERKHQGRTYVMLANRDREAGYDVTVELTGEGGVEQWDFATGKTHPISARVADGKTVVQLHLDAVGSAALVLDPKAGPVTRTPRPETRVTKEVTLSREWQPRRSVENSYPLDTCRWRFTGGEWSESLPVWVAQKQLREQMGLVDTSPQAVAQPWVRYATPSTAPSRPVELRFTFPVARAPERIDLVLEAAELFEIMLNGKGVPNAARGWWLDPSMDRISLPRLRRGENELVLRCDYRDAPEYELEDCYLIGDFGVDRATDAIGAEPAALRPGDWCDQGYPYYTGSMYYGQEVDVRLRPGERAILKVGPQYSGCVAVHVNGKLAEARAWPPYQADITRHLKRGRNRIEIELCGSPRNLLGPNHVAEKRPVTTGPFTFVALWNWVPERNLVPYGLFGDAVLQVTK
jgi:hypothetical protein